MTRAFLLFPLLTVACTSADGLNLGQRGYLVQDARLALEAAAQLNATALFAELLFGDGAVSAGASSETNIERVVSRVSTLLEDCPGAVVEGSYSWVELSMDCERDGVHWKIDETVFLIGSSPLTVRLFPVFSEIGGVEMAPAAVTFPGGSLQLSTTDWSSLGRVLEFAGTIESDDALTAATLSGTGQWVDESVEGSALPVTFEAFAVTASSCAPKSGALLIGPRDVLIDPDTSIPIAQRITPGPASGQATVLVGVTEETVTVGCPR